jgi:hypothetical protein
MELRAADKVMVLRLGGWADGLTTARRNKVGMLRNVTKGIGLL